MDTSNRNESTRRGFLKAAGAGAAAFGLTAVAGSGRNVALAKRDYEISVAGWSLHRTIGEGKDKIPQLDMPKVAREEFDIGAIELVNRMLASTTPKYLDQLAKNAAEHDVKILLIMVDGEGSIGATREDGRLDAVKRHKKWMDIAAGLGCHSIRMNWAGARHDVVENEQALHEFIQRSTHPFRLLCEHGDTKNINVIIENHGGPSSYPKAMEQLMNSVDHPRFGTLPDFGNFPRKDDGSYAIDVYDAVDRLMPFAKAVSAKCYDFDDDTGNETTLDYERLINIVVDKHGYHGHIGIEYEGNRLSEFEGIKACKRLLERLKA